MTNTCSSETRHRIAAVSTSASLLKMAALDGGVLLRDVQIAALNADPRTTIVYDRRRQNFDRHAAYVVVAFVAGG